MRKKDIINFAPTGVNRRRRTPGYVGFIVFACIALFVGSVLIILAINDFDIGRALGAREAETEATDDGSSSSLSVSASPKPELSSREEYTFLVICSDKSEVLFAQLIYVRPADAQIKIVPVPEDRAMKTEDGEMSFSDMFRTASLGTLCEAFSRDSVNVDRYVHVTEENYRILLSNLGAVSVQVEEHCEFNVDAVKYTFEPGIREMTSDMLIKYLKYAGNEKNRDRIRALVTLSVFRQHFTKSNFEKGEGFFSSLINSVDSNITAFDYGAAKPIIESMLSDTTEITVTG